MASGLIYLAIAGMWVAYFLPRWVHNRDEFSGKSVERYKSALRVVANSSGHVGASAIYSELDREAKASQLLMRRRIVFTVLALSLIVSVIGGVMKAFTWLVILIPATGLLMYVAHVRRAIHSESITRRRIENLHRATEGVSHANFSEVFVAKESTEHWIPLAERTTSGVTILPKGSAAARNQWQPNEVPLPTYATAPKAIPAKRIIDLTEPGRWSEEQERLEREALAAAAPSSDDVFDQQLADEAADRFKASRRAVNE